MLGSLETRFLGVLNREVPVLGFSSGERRVAPVDCGVVGSGISLGRKSGDGGRGISAGSSLAAKVDYLVDLTTALCIITVQLHT